jgi:hypothetical protein
MRGQYFWRCGPFDSKHGYHKAEVTIKSDFIGVLSHNDPNTKTIEVNMGRRIQNKSPKKQKTTTTAEDRVDEGWEPSWEAREKHTLPKDSLSASWSAGGGSRRRWMEQADASRAGWVLKLSGAWETRAYSQVAVETTETTGEHQRRRGTRCWGPCLEPVEGGE